MNGGWQVGTMNEIITEDALSNMNVPAMLTAQIIKSVQLKQSQSALIDLEATS